MKRTIIIMVCLLGLSIPGFAQLPPNGTAKTMIPIQGGKDGKNYAIILATSLSKTELVDKTIEVLKSYGLMDDTYVRSAEISEELTEFSIPILVRSQMAYLPYMMGAKIIHQPVSLFCNIRFEFHNNGKVMIVYENFDTKTFVLIDKSTQTAYMKDYDIPELQEYGGHQSAVVMGNSLLGKVLIAVNKGLDGYKEWKSQASNYLQNVNTEYAIYEKVKESGYGNWLTDAEIIALVEKTPDTPGIKQLLKFAKDNYDRQGLLWVNERRWQEQIKPIQDMFFKSIAVYLGATVEGVAEDGEETWVTVDGVVVPADPKEQKKYIKKKEYYW